MKQHNKGDKNKCIKQSADCKMNKEMDQDMDKLDTPQNRDDLALSLLSSSGSWYEE